MRRSTTRAAAASLAPSPFHSSREREDLERVLLSASNSTSEVSASETVATAVPVTDGIETSYVAMATVVPVPLPNAAAPAGSATSGSSSSRAMYSESSTQNLGDRDQTQQINETKKKDDGFDEDEIQVRPSSPPPAHGSDRPVLASYNPTKASEEMYEESQEEHSRTAAKIRAANARGAMEADAERSAAAAAEREPRWIQYETSAAVKVANMNAEYKSRSKDEGLTMEDRLAAMALENSRKAPASDGEGGTEDSINPYKQSVDSVGYKVGEYSFEDDYETAEYETSQYKSVYD